MSIIKMETNFTIIHFLQMHIIVLQKVWDPPLLKMLVYIVFLMLSMLILIELRPIVLQALRFR